MTRKEAINIIQGAIGHVEWDQPMHIAVALDKAIEALEQPEVILCMECEYKRQDGWCTHNRHETTIGWWCADGKRKEFDPHEET